MTVTVKNKKPLVVPVAVKLTEGLADIKAGRTHGPFSSADEMIAHVQARLEKRSPGKQVKRLDRWK